VIYHGTLGDAGRRLAEIWRVLKPGALYQGTMLPTRNINYGRGRTVAPDTFVVDGAEERGHPHFYCDAITLVTRSPGHREKRHAQILGASQLVQCSEVLWRSCDLAKVGRGDPLAGWARAYDDTSDIIAWMPDRR
jgi:hypothetical protein